MANLSRNEKIAVWVGLVVVVVAFLAFGLFSNEVEEITDVNMINDTENEVANGNGSGVDVTVVSEGMGEIAEEGDLITVHYVGTLENGTVFDSSLERGQPFQFVLGAGQVIPGWEQGILGMKEGGVRELSIPPELAYGDQAVGSIPPNSRLIFEVELLEVQKRQQ